MLCVSIIILSGISPIKHLVYLISLFKVAVKGIQANKYTHINKDMKTVIKIIF